MEQQAFLRSFIDRIEIQEFHIAVEYVNPLKKGQRESLLLKKFCLSHGLAPRTGLELLGVAIKAHQSFAIVVWLPGRLSCRST
jgi:hypothetical protein